MKKQTILMLFMVAIAVALSACGTPSDNSGTNDTTSAGTVDTTPVSSDTLMSDSTVVDTTATDSAASN